MSTKIICVYNKQDFFEKVVKICEFHQNCEIIGYDNTIENTAITKHYNHFIKENIMQNTDSEDIGFWSVFMHQDFAFREDINLALENLDKNYIYGPIGVKFLSPIIHRTEEGFDPSKLIILGKIAQRMNSQFIYFGEEVKEPTTVDAIDCCCIIMHSSLIKKYQLLFDENLNFHMYAEELCYRAKKDFGIETKVTQLGCFHLGMGVINQEFRDSAQYLKDKFKINKIPSTCPN